MVLPLFPVLFSICSWLKANLSFIVRFLFYPFGSLAVVRLPFPASASSPTSHQKVATCPLTNCTSSSSMVFYFDYVVKWFIRQLNGQIGLQNFICHSLIPPSNLVSHRAQSPPSDLEPPDPTVFALITWLTFSTVSRWWEVVFSLICVMQWMESLVLCPNPLTAQYASYIPLVLERRTHLSP